MKEMRSRTFRLKNAVVTIHGFAADSAILNISTTNDNPSHAAVWVSAEELIDLGQAFADGGYEITQELKL